MYTEAYIYVLLSILEVVTMVALLRRWQWFLIFLGLQVTIDYASKYVTKCSLTVILYTQHTPSINKLHSSA